MVAEGRRARKFYEKFGEEVTNELVNWFNAVDATYKADLRELNDHNFARFDARMGERLGELKSGLLKWMFGFWASVVVALAVLALRA